MKVVERYGDWPLSHREHGDRPRCARDDRISVGRQDTRGEILHPRKARVQDDNAHAVRIRVGGDRAGSLGRQYPHG